MSKITWVQANTLSNIFQDVIQQGFKTQYYMFYTKVHLYHLQWIRIQTRNTIMLIGPPQVLKAGIAFTAK